MDLWSPLTFVPGIFPRPSSEYTLLSIVFRMKNNYSRSWFILTHLKFCIRVSPCIFPLPSFECTLFLTVESRKIIIYRLEFQNFSLCFVPVLIQHWLLNISIFLFARSASFISSRHPLLSFYLPSALYIKYIYKYHHIMSSYITAPSDSSLYSLSVDYSTLLPMVPSCSHIMLSLCCHGWLLHFRHYLVNPRDLRLFIIQIW